jgi:hypothetical protein
MYKITSFLAGLALATAIPIASPGAAQEAPTAASMMKAGTAIVDTAGNAVGTVASVSDGNAIVDTGTHKIAIPGSSFGATGDKLLLAATMAQLNAAAEGAAAAAKAALAAAMVPGAEIRGDAGTVIGSIKSVEGDIILVTTPDGDVRVPSAGFSKTSQGLVLNMSATDFATAVSAAKAASAS